MPDAQRVVTAELLAAHGLHVVSDADRDALETARGRIAELEAELVTAIEHYGKESELKLVATIELRDLRRRVRAALQFVRDETNESLEGLLEHVEEALD